MLIYHYDRETKEYIGSEQAFKSPREKDIYFIPANATTLEPPECMNQQKQVFENGCWLLKNDYRNQVQVEISTKQISKVESLGELKKGFQLISEQEAEEISRNPEMFDVVEGKLVNISGTQAYKNKLVQQKRQLWEKEFIKTSHGWLRIDTAMGDLLSLLNSIKIITEIKNKLDAGTILFYATPDFTKEVSEEYIKSLQFWNKELSYQEFMLLYSDVANAYLMKFKGA